MEAVVVIVIVLDPFEGSDIKRKVLLWVGWVSQDDVWAKLCTALAAEIQGINSRVGVIIRIGSIR